MTTSVVLPDSTVVYLNSESSLRYPSVFEDDIRNVELKGEAYFAVAKDLKKKFVVSAPHSSQIEVLVHTSMWRLMKTSRMFRQHWWKGRSAFILVIKTIWPRKWL